MKKRFLFLVMAFVVCQGLQAQNTDALKYFNLVMPDHSLVSYELSDGIDIRFQDSIMVINDLSFYMEEGVKYYFSEDENAVDENADDNGSYVGGDKLYVRGSGKGDIIVSDMSGRIVYSKPNSKDCVIDLAPFSSNTLYLIRVNNQTFKFIKR
jgi:hypothetical protein